MSYEQDAAAVGAQADAQISSLTADAALKDAHIDALTSQNTALSGQVVSVTAQNSILTTQVDTLTAQSSAQQNQISILQAQVTSLQAQLDALNPAPTPDPTPDPPPVPVDLGRKVFAHYFVPYPLSLDNKAQPDYYETGYLSPTGESGKHAAYGGLLRDRPVVRAPLSGDWELADMVTEVKTAKAYGLDGFTVDLLSTDSTAWNVYPGSLGSGTSRNARLVKKLLNAAAANDFKIVLMPDMTASVGSLTPAALATYVSGLGNYSSAFRLDDGRLVVSPFKAENWSVANWQAFIDAMGGETKVALVPCFLNAPANIAAFAPISYGFSNWGNRSPAGNPTTGGIATTISSAHSMGKIWMQPVSVQDERPNQSIYDEAMNTKNLRNTWSIAILNNVEWVQIVTWNDYSEGAQYSPSRNNNGAWAKLGANYFIPYFKSGKIPPITKDQVYLSHRKQPYAAKPTGSQTKFMTLRSGSSPAVDTVEALVVLTAPATVGITVGGTVSTFNAPAGISAFTVPLKVGAVGVVVNRNGDTIASVSSPVLVTSTPPVQDLSYYASTNM